MGLLATVLDAFDDDKVKDNDIIKSGTLRTTRATALVAVSVVAIMALLNELAPSVAGLDELTAAQKFFGAISIGFIWSITAAADALSRGLAAGASSSATQHANAYAAVLQNVAADEATSLGFRIIDPPLQVRLTDKAGDDAERGWLAVATALKGNEAQVCLVKENDVEWRSSRDKHIKWQSGT